MISVVIPAFNEEEKIGHCLASLTRQKTRRPFEVIVVDNQSTDDTTRVARGFGDELNLTVAHESLKSRGAARRTGFALASGDMIFSTDADTVVPSDWIETLAAALERNGGTVAVTGPSAITDCTRFTNITHNIFTLISKRVFRIFFGYYCLCGYNFAISRKAYEEAGGFDRRTDAHDDIDLTYRVSRVGRICYVPVAAVTVSGRRFRQGFLRGFIAYPKTFVEKYWLGKGLVRLQDVR